MENNGPPDHGGRRRRGAEYVDIIATIHFLEKILLKIIIGAIGITGAPAITNLEIIVCIYTVLVIAGQVLKIKMGRQGMDPRFQLTSIRIAVILGCVRCCLLVYIPLCVMPWSTFVLCILSLMNP